MGAGEFGGSWDVSDVANPSGDDTKLPSGRSLSKTPTNRGIADGVPGRYGFGCRGSGATDSSPAGIGSVPGEAQPILDAAAETTNSICKPVDELKKHLSSLRDTEKKIGEMIENGNYDASTKLVKAAQRKALAVLDEAIKFQGYPPVKECTVDVDDIHDAERRLEIPIGTFDSCFVAQDATAAQNDAVDLRHLLTEVRGNVARLPLEPEPREVPRWVAPVLRISSAVLVGAVIGAPIAAFAVHESILNEMVKAGIATGVGALGAEATNAAIDKLGPDSET